MKLTCVIIDDEYLGIQVLQEYASRMPELEVLCTFTNPMEALSWLQTNRTDLLLLDIQMPYLDGLALMEQLPSPPLVIFTTARHDYALQAFDLDVVDYLVKPVGYDRFRKAIEKAADYAAVQSRKKKTDDHFLTIKAEYRLNKVSFKDIIYIEGLNEYVRLHTAAKTHITLASLKDLAVELHTPNFVRVHKSYIVNIDCIASFSAQSIQLKDGKEIPVGRSYKSGFLERMK